MELSTLLEGVKIKSIKGIGSLKIKGIAIDSRRVRAGDLFFALKGSRTDGNAFIKDAIMKGAAAVLTDQPFFCEHPEQAPDGEEVFSSAALIRVEDGRAALARISANFHKNPSLRLSVTGITGTNGKTTTALLVHGGLGRLGRGSGLIGTIKYIAGGIEKPAPHTTPEAPDFQRMLEEMEAAGQSHAVAEVSSHALAQKRVDCTSFKVAVFTNLTRDHLDYHKTMENYFEAKKRLFNELLEAGGLAVINSDDPFGKRLASEISFSGKGTVLAYSAANGPGKAGMPGVEGIRAENIRNTASGLRFDISCQGRKFPISSRLIGAHNVYNLLAAFGALTGLGFDAEEAIRGLESLEGVNGRFERVECGQEFLAVIDYAHTPDALQRLIQAARAVSSGRVITLFGCGGDRDKGKRREMGLIAATLSDVAVITSDNPRSEDPADIIGDIKEGIPADRAGHCLVIADRAEAIERAIGMARAGDAVLIAGKGHEDYQEINGVRSPFNDRLAAVTALEKRKR